jgi:hypothetical protein
MFWLRLPVLQRMAWMFPESVAADNNRLAPRGNSAIISGIEPPNAGNSGGQAVSYAILINLDYEHHPAQACAILWEEINRRMVEAGFHVDGRTFVINLPEHEACELARKVMEQIEDHLEYHHRHMHKYLKDFIGFPADTRRNLLLPPVESIDVETLDEEGSNK